MLKALKTISENVMKFVKKLQRAPDGTKKIYVAGASALTVILVIIIWVYFLKTALPNINPLAPEAAENQSREESLWEVFGRGFTKIIDDFSQKFSETKNQLGQSLEELQAQLQKTNEITVEKETAATSSTGTSPITEPPQLP